MEDRQLVGVLLIVLLTLVVAWVVAGMMGLWVSAAQFRQVYGLYQKAQATADESVATTKAVTNALEGVTPDYQDRRFLTDLRRKMGKYLSDEEIQDLCFDMEVGYENLPASTHTGKVRELLEELRRQNRVSELLVILGRDRPDVDWMKVEVA